MSVRNTSSQPLFGELLRQGRDFEAAGFVAFDEVFNEASQLPCEQTVHAVPQRHHFPWRVTHLVLPVVPLR